LAQDNALLEKEIDVTSTGMSFRSLNTAIYRQLSETSMKESDSRPQSKQKKES